MRSDIPIDSLGETLRRVLGGGASSIVAIVVLLVLLFNSFEIVGAGERGVVFSKFGGVQQTVRGEGLQLKIPFVQTIVPLDVRMHKSETDASASSKDLQTVDSRIALNYHIAPELASKIYQEVGILYKERAHRPIGPRGRQGCGRPVHGGRADHPQGRGFCLDQEYAGGAAGSQKHHR